MCVQFFRIYYFKNMVTEKFSVYHVTTKGDISSTVTYYLHGMLAKKLKNYEHHPPSSAWLKLRLTGFQPAMLPVASSITSLFLIFQYSDQNLPFASYCMTSLLCACPCKSLLEMSFYRRGTRKIK